MSETSPQPRWGLSEDEIASRLNEVDPMLLDRLESGCDRMGLGQRIAEVAMRDTLLAHEPEKLRELGSMLGKFLLANNPDRARKLIHRQMKQAVKKDRWLLYVWDKVAPYVLSALVLLVLTAIALVLLLWAVKIVWVNLPV